MEFSRKTVTAIDFSRWGGETQRRIRVGGTRANRLGAGRLPTLRMPKGIPYQHCSRRGKPFPPRGAGEIADPDGEVVRISPIPAPT